MVLSRVAPALRGLGGDKVPDGGAGALRSVELRGELDSLGLGVLDEALGELLGRFR
eukprot:CAMPEP_0197567340 /NCGR_PEP_ID=MMETSP1320-20131121/35453_1 /TAXON_ID=91990 /ORGANISM="Bolidomonas sp., Strain RCC2347" /LENGTH=55 /DNA_ID=CAMNT_0043129515 /DNA_START=24 /DNA_END=187 /DNA_ORIENTATION=-